MFRIGFYAVVGLAAWTAACIHAAAGPVIVRDGVPCAAIVISDTPSESARRAANELQRVIARMSGAPLPILGESEVRPEGHVWILVGRSSLVTEKDIPSGEDRDHSREGFIIRVGTDRVILAGNEDCSYRGTEYAVSELLERLGCRWYFPGEFGEVIPLRRTVVLPDLDVLERPAFAIRNIWCSGWTDSPPGFEEWLVRNKGTDRSAFAFPGDGTIWKLAPPERWAGECPDLYAMSRDGTRQSPTTSHENIMLCLSHPRALDIAASSVADFFRAHPEAGSFAFSAPDHAAICWCASCRARCNGFEQDSGLGESISDLYFNFVNHLAWRVNESFPGKRLVTLAYATRVWPPEDLDRAWNTNLLVYLAQLRVSAVRPLGDPTDVFALRRARTVEAWDRLASGLVIYDYDPHADLSRMPYWRSRAIAEEMRHYRSRGIIGFTTEGYYAILRSGLNYYLRARCMWNPDVDSDALVTDFAERFFGPAADSMKAYLEAVETMLRQTPDAITWHPYNLDWTPTFPPDKVAALTPLLDRAQQAADTPACAVRVRAFRLLHEYMSAYLDIHALAREGRFAEALRKADDLAPLMAEAEAIQPGLLPPDPNWVLNEGNGLASLTNALAAWAARAGGALGDVLGRAPEHAGFLKDPGNIGLFEQWQRPEVGSRLAWDSVSLDRDWGLNGYRDGQGYAYDGVGWYRVVIPVPSDWRGRARLLAPLVFAEQAWIWVNGRLVFSPTRIGGDPVSGPSPGKAVMMDRRGYGSIEVDVQDLLVRGADNVVTFRIKGSRVRTQHRGLAARPWIWAARSVP